MRAFVRVSCLLLAASVLPGCAAKVVTTRSLLHEMTDLAGMAELPDPPYTCRQLSSYDRKSKSPDEDWFANADWGQFIREEQRDDRTEYVMMDADGPGAIVRIWSANPKGTLRIYLDHGDTPVIEAPMTDVLGGKLPGIPKPIAGERSRGWNSYFPIPYARHCKVTSDEGRFYYHINYRTYSPWAAQVVSFEPSDLESLADEVSGVATRLASPRTAAALAPPIKLGSENSGVPEGWRQVAPGATVVLDDDSAGSSAKAITAFCIKVEAEDIDDALRELVLAMTFDGEETVCSPVGDFFGAAPGVNAYESLPMGVTENGEMWSHWIMPYRESARIELRNTGNQPAKVRHVAAIMPDYEWTDRSMHFHAGWKTEFDVPSRPHIDWNYCSLRGRGVFAGVAFAVANPVRHWWGEGDEKIYVDGETFPSHFGTGTEDYYGYAWCCPEPFTHAYHNQPRCDGPGNYGHTAVNRWHIIDRIPFERDFRFDMELWHSHKDTNTTVSAVTYWYARPGATSDHAKIDPVDLQMTKIPPYEPPKVAGAIEGEDFEIIEKVGIVEPQRIWDCSNDQHLWWREAQPGDRLVLGFPAPSTGQYRVFARFLTARDYGVIGLSINDEPAGDPIDFYNDGVKKSDEIELGVFTLHEGENRLAAEIVGTNEKAVKRYMFGLDYLRLEPETHASGG